MDESKVDEKFSRKRQQEEFDSIAASRNEDADEQRAILASFKEGPKHTSTPLNGVDSDDLRQQVKTMEEKIRELESANRTLVLQSHRAAQVKEPAKTSITRLGTSKDVLKKTIAQEGHNAKSTKAEVHTAIPEVVNKTTELKPKLRSENIPGPNTKMMVESISSKVGKGPIPEKSDLIPVRPIHQVPAQSAIGKAIEDLGNISHKGITGGNPGDPDGNSSSSESSSSSGSSTGSKSKSRKRKSRAK